MKPEAPGGKWALGLRGLLGLVGAAGAWAQAVGPGQIGTSRLPQPSDVVFMYQAERAVYEAYGATVLAWGGTPNARALEAAHDVRFFGSVGMVTEFARYHQRFPADYAEGLCRDRQGQPFKVPWLTDHQHEGIPYWWCCTSQPRFRQYLEERVRETVRAGAYGVHLDDHLGSAGALFLGGCYCDRCEAGFRRHLGGLAEGERTALGVGDTAAFSFRAGLGAWMAERTNGQERRASEHPLWGEWATYHARAAAAFMAHLKELAGQEAGRPVPFSANAGLLWPLHLSDYPTLTFFSAEIDHGAATRRPTDRPLFAYRLADAVGRPLASTASGQDWAFIQEQNLPGLVRTWIALSYAAGHSLMAPHRQWCYTEAKGTHWYAGPQAKFAPLYQFVREQAAWLDRYHAFAEVAVLMPHRAFLRSRDRWLDLAQRLNAAQVSWRLVLGGDAIVPSALGGPELEACAVWVDPAPGEFTPEDRAQVAARLAATGCKVVPSAEQAIRGLVPAVRVKEPGTVRALPRVRPGHAVIHLLNQDYDAAADDVRAQRGVAVEVDLAALGVAGCTQASVRGVGTAPTEVRVEAGRITVPELGLWAMIHLTTEIPRAIPSPRPDHAGNIHLEGEPVRLRLPEALPAEESLEWRLQDDGAEPVRTGRLTAAQRQAGVIEMGALPVGWYRAEFGTFDPRKPERSWTTAAVLPVLRAPTPMDSPIGLDSAAAWFARNDTNHQQQLANLATLAGVNWVRDRLRWGDLEPEAERFAAAGTTYDTSAAIQRAAGLQVLQVFHDTPAWAREGGDGSGRFARDLRHGFRLSRTLAERFRGQVAAWEPWNEANIAVFGGHTVDEMCGWQKAAWLGFKVGDPALRVGWNVTAAVPTPSHTTGVLLNETWPYYDTYNIHTYDWSHAYADLWEPARQAAGGRPLWITEADRGTPHLKNAPWFEQEPRLERLKAEWMAQSYAASLFAGADRHFHFILGHYHEPNGVQFGLLRRDLTPRPAYVALAAVGRLLAGAQPLGRWRPGQEVQVYAFRAFPAGRERDVLVVWAEREVDWEARGRTDVDWRLPARVKVEEVWDYLGRKRTEGWPPRLGSAPWFVVLPRGEAGWLPLETPKTVSPWRPGKPSSLVLQLTLPSEARERVEDLPWSEGYAYRVAPDTELELPLSLYNFGAQSRPVRLQLAQFPADWQVSVNTDPGEVAPGDRNRRVGRLRIPSSSPVGDGWVKIEAVGEMPGDRTVLAFRVRRTSQ